MCPARRTPKRMLQGLHFLILCLGLRLQTLNIIVLLLGLAGLATTRAVRLGLNRTRSGRRREKQHHGSARAFHEERFGRGGTRRVAVEASEQVVSSSIYSGTTAWREETVLPFSAASRTIVVTIGRTWSCRTSYHRNAPEGRPLHHGHSQATEP